MLADGNGPPTIAGVQAPSSQNAIFLLCACASIIEAYSSLKLSRDVETATAVDSPVPLQDRKSVV